MACTASSMAAQNRTAHSDTKDLSLQMQFLFIHEDLQALIPEQDEASSNSDTELALRAYKDEIVKAIGHFGDRDFALRLSGQEGLAVAATRGLNNQEIPRAQQTAEAARIVEDNCAILAAPLREMEEEWHGKRLVECSSCNAHRPRGSGLEGPCGHFYCKGCIIELFSGATTDETLFPPRCCKQPISVEKADKLLPEDVSRDFKKKSIEFSTPPADRKYCSDASCSIFITNDNVSGNEASCPECPRKTCIICKAAAHDNDCPDDPTMKALLDTAKEEGWQRCFKCNALVELISGCNHITCRCKAQFCFVCGVEWTDPRQCTCAAFDEHHVLAGAVRRAARGRPANGVVNRAAVEREARRLRERHDCTHDTGFSFRHGGAICDMCTADMPVFIMECDGCGVQFCRRCTHNRL